jgi:hypothetical protein
MEQIRIVDIVEIVGLLLTIIGAAVKLGRYEQRVDVLEEMVKANSRRCAGVGAAVDVVRRDLNEHQIEDAQVYLAKSEYKEDLRGLAGRLDGILRRIDEIGDRRAM